MICSLILPLGIGFVHAFHEHDENICQAKDESHIHSERSDCNDLHYFSQTLGDFTLGYESLTTQQYFDLNALIAEFLLIKTRIQVISDRGPPVINAF